MSEQTSATLPLVALVGRPNVGKSTLFNRIVGRRLAIVEGAPGTTRDRHYGEAEWRGVAFRVVDTGGLQGEQITGPYALSVADQVREALLEADVVCLVVDAQQGVLPADEDVAHLLREASQRVLLVANKVDHDGMAAAAAEFHLFGLGPVHPISAHHALGVGDLLDLVVADLPRLPVHAPAVACRLAIVGRPNVGKSSLINAILRTERMIVSETPGTTRDAVDTPVTFDGREMVLVDTAGIRRRGRIDRGVEKQSVGRAQRAMERADVAAVVLDAAEGMTAQDQHILGMAVDAFRGVIIVINKSDLMDEFPERREQWDRELPRRARFLPWTPVVWTSALRSSNLDVLLRAALSAADQRRRRIPTAELNAAIRRATIDHPPAAVHGRALKFFFVTQAEIAPPTFVFFVNFPEAIHFSYKRYLQRRIREAFGFEGAAIRLLFRKRGAAND